MIINDTNRNLIICSLTVLFLMFFKTIYIYIYIYIYIIFLNKLVQKF